MTHLCTSVDTLRVSLRSDLPAVGRRDTDRLSPPLRIPRYLNIATLIQVLSVYFLRRCVCGQLDSDCDLFQGPSV